MRQSRFAVCCPELGKTTAASRLGVAEATLEHWTRTLRFGKALSERLDIVSAEFFVHRYVRSKVSMQTRSGRTKRHRGRARAAHQRIRTGALPMLPAALAALDIASNESPLHFLE